MLIHNPIFTGSISLNGADISQISTVSSDSSSFASRITSTESTASAFILASGSFSDRTTLTEATASEYVATSGSLSTRVTATEATASAFITASGSLSARIASNEARTGSFATTGSNYFIGNQVITGSVYIANDLVVQGSSSLQNITASVVSIGTNTVILNTNTPILQFGGISVFDSGSTQGRSGSLLWNSINDHWINVNPSGSDEGYNSAMVINGPKNTGSLGQEAGLTTGYIPRSQGEDHIEDSPMFSTGSNVGIGTTNLGPDGLSLFVQNNYSWSEGSGNAYAVLFRQRNSGATVVASGYKRSNTAAFASSFGTSMARAAIAVGYNNGSIAFFTDTATNVANGTDITPTERVTIINSGNVGIGTDTPTGTYGKLSVAGGISILNDNNAKLEIGRYSSGTPNSYIKLGANSNSLRFTNNTDAADIMELTNAGNLGLGVTPSAWGTASARVAIEMSTGGSSIWAQNFGGSNPSMQITCNAYEASGGSIYKVSSQASYYQQNAGNHTWYTAPSGTAGNAITFTPRMTILVGGNIGIGTTSPNAPLDVTSVSSNSSGIQQWSYNSAPVAYRLQLNTIVSSGLVKYSFDMSNNSTAYNNTLVLTNGNIGIGTASPAASLHVLSTAAQSSIIATTNATTLYQTFRYNSSTDVGYIGNGTGLVSGGNGIDFGIRAENNLIFAISNSEKMRITSGGFSKFTNTGAYQGGNYHEFRSSTNNSNVLFACHTNTSPFGFEILYSGGSPNAASNQFLYFSDTSAARLYVNSNGGIANFQSNNVNLSDERTKKDISPLDSYWNKFKDIEIVKFKYKDQTHDDFNIGVIAQQVEQVAPEFVDIDGWGETPEDEIPLKSIYTADLHHATIKVLQEAIAKIETLEAKVAALEAQQ